MTTHGRYVLTCNYINVTVKAHNNNILLGGHMAAARVIAEEYDLDRLAPEAHAEV